MDEKTPQITQQTIQEPTTKVLGKEEVRQIIKEELAFMIKNKKLVFPYPIQILDGNDIVLGQTNGTRFGTAASQLLAFFGVSPRVQYAHGYLLNRTGGATQDAEARAGVADINALLVGFGFAKDVT